MQTLVLSIIGKDLSDPLFFHRLKSNLKKLSSKFRFVLIHEALFQYHHFTANRLPDKPNEKELELYSDFLTQQGKLLTIKLSDDQIPTIQLNAHHLGLTHVSKSRNILDGELKEINVDMFVKLFSSKAILVISPIFISTEGERVYIAVDVFASFLATKLCADFLFFIDESQNASHIPLNDQSTQHDTNSPILTFKTNLAGMEKVLYPIIYNKSESILHKPN